MKRNLIGEMIKKYRSQNLWSQETFAEQCGISGRTLQRIENGEKGNIETIRAIANFLKIGTEKLLPLNESVSDENWQRLVEELKNEADKLEKELSTLLEMKDAKELLVLTSSCETYQHDHPTPGNDEEVRAFGGVLQSIRDYSDIHDNMEPFQKVEFVAQLQNEIQELNNLGFKIFAGRMKGWVVQPGTAINGKPPLKFRCAAVVIKHETDNLIFKNKAEKDRASILIRSSNGDEAQAA